MNGRASCFLFNKNVNDHMLLSVTNNFINKSFRRFNLLNPEINKKKISSSYLKGPFNIISGRCDFFDCCLSLEWNQSIHRDFASNYRVWFGLTIDHLQNRIEFDKKKIHSICRSHLKQKQYANRVKNKWHEAIFHLCWLRVTFNILNEQDK